MPLFDYRCEGCGARFEMLVQRHDVAVTCPDCGAADVRRLLSTFAVTTSRSGAADAGPGPCGSTDCACRR